MDIFSKSSLKESTINVVITVILQVVFTCGWGMYLAVLLLFLISWVSKLTKLSKSAQPSQSIAFAKSCLKLYNELGEGMGPLIFTVLSTCQCSCVCNSFLALSMAVGGSSGLPDCAIHLLMALGIFCQTTAIVFSLDDCHKSMKVLSKSLMTDMIEMEPGRSRREAKSVLKVQLLFISQSVKMWLFRSWRLQGP